MGQIGYHSGICESNNVLTFIKQHALATPEHTAFIYSYDGCTSPTRITYTTFMNRAKALARILQAEGVGKSDTVLVFIPLCPELYITIAALEWLGAVPVFLDSWTRESDILHAFHVTQPVAFVADTRTLSIYHNLCKEKGIFTKIAYDSETFALGETDAELPITPVSPEDTALVTFTTGSSGTPKGANRTHRFLSAQHTVLKDLFPYTARDIDMPIFPIFALNSLASGVPIALPRIRAVNAFERIRELVEQIMSYQATCVTLSPALFSALASFGAQSEFQMPRIRRVLTGGAPISERDIDRFCEVFPSTDVQILYGSTEVEPIAHIDAITIRTHTKASVTKSQPLSERGVVVGPIVHGLRYAFIDPKTPPHTGPVTLETIMVHGGAIGELVVAGEHVCRDYYQDEDAVIRTKIHDIDGTVWHRTGDLGHLDKQGYLWIVGRSHNIIRAQDGTLYFPVRTEILLREIPGVQDAAYLNRDAEQKGPVVVAISFQETVTDTERASLCMQAHNLLTRLHFPVDEILPVNHIPMDIRHHSKVDYLALRVQLFQYGNNE